MQSENSWLLLDTEYAVLKNILISIKFILNLINHGNGFIHQTSHVFSFSGVFILRFDFGFFLLMGWYKVSILSTILPININDFCRYCNMRHYQNPAVNMRNQLTPWTKQSVECFSSNYVSFSARVWNLLTFSWCSLCQILSQSFLLLNICPL